RPRQLRLPNPWPGDVRLPRRAHRSHRPRCGSHPQGCARVTRSATAVRGSRADCPGQSLRIFSADRNNKELSMALSKDEKAATLKEFGDRKSTRLNSSHVSISYAVFCLKKKSKT